MLRVWPELLRVVEGFEAILVEGHLVGDCLPHLIRLLISRRLLLLMVDELCEILADASLIKVDILATEDSLREGVSMLFIVATL